ncbi:MFS transporter [Brevibacterium sp. VCM10]|uniref:MFS transporter n=1 Tax=Brevibacterium sp. VCM10 TaxID=1381751 RepID=UPI00046F0901|nr:MFS transporter [Brevibacterium sp. VCM10]
MTVTESGLAGRSNKRILAVVGFLVFVEFSSGFLQGYYLPLLDAVRDHLGVSDASIAWFITVQTLAAGVCVPILSKLGDIFGHRRILRIGIVTVLIGTVLVAWAPSYPLVLLGRVLTGPIAVWLPLELAIVHNQIQGETARRAIGMLISALTIGALIGSLAAGLFSSLLPSMAAQLMVPVVMVAISAVFVCTLVPESTARTSPVIDWLGFILLALFMLVLLAGIKAVTSQVSLGAALIAAAIVLTGVFVWWELRTGSPALNLRVLTSNRLWPVYVTSFLFGMVLFGTQSITTTFLAGRPELVGYGFGLSAGTISLINGTNMLLAAVGAAVYAYIAKGISLKGVLILGSGTIAISQLLLIVGHASLPLVVVGIALAGFGSGLLLGGLPAATTEASPADETGIATGVYNSVKTLGGALAGAVFALILGLFIIPEAGASGVGGYISIWVICAAATGLCPVLLALIRPEKKPAAPTSVPATTAAGQTSQSV